MTDNEIIKARSFEEQIAYFKKEVQDFFTSYKKRGDGEDCIEICLIRGGFRTVLRAEEEVNRQKAEIERLKTVKQHINTLICRECDYATAEAYNNAFQKALEQLHDNANTRAEAIKEFAERLKERYSNIPLWGTVAVAFMEDIKKEMVGEQE